MNRFTLLSLAMLFLFVIACKAPAKKDNPTSPATTETGPQEPAAPAPEDQPEVVTETPPVPPPTPEVTEPVTPPPTEPLPEPPTPPAVTSANASLPCAADFNLEKSVNEAAIKLSGVPYSQPNKTDCSGMYHKLLNELRNGCPDGEMPVIEIARSTRGLASWYHQKGQFQIVRDPAAMSKLIQPGAVMFYGYGARLGKYNERNLVMDSLTVRYVGINHVSIVTSVKRENGQVVSYEMFHGRNPGAPSGITTSERVYKRHPELPMYGNWKETWVGVVKTPMLPKEM